MTYKLEIPTYNAERLAEIFESYIPFNKFLGLRCLEIRHGSVRVELPYRPDHVENPEIPALHGGAISATLDTGDDLRDLHLSPLGNRFVLDGLTSSNLRGCLARMESIRETKKGRG
jgi:hypothetical protein